MNEDFKKVISYSNGNVAINDNHEIIGYELVEDNPTHCLQICDRNLWVCIYPDGINIQSPNKDGFNVKYQKNIPYKLIPKKIVLPDPEQTGQLYQAKTKLFAVKMDKDFEVESWGSVRRGKAGDYLVKQNGRAELWSAKEFEERFENSSTIAKKEINSQVQPKGVTLSDCGSDQMEK
jgi:hypothetical protein